MTAASPASLAEDGLIELSRASASERLQRRDYTGLLAAAFVVVALGALALPAHRALDPLALAVCVACYALAARVRFEFGNVFAIPTQPVFVAMWFLLPPRALPLVVLGSLLLSELPDVVRRRMPLDRLALLAVSSWFSVGPMLVVFLWASHAPRWSATPVYVAALLAQLACDYVANFLLARQVLGVTRSGGPV